MMRAAPRPTCQRRRRPCRCAWSVRIRVQPGVPTCGGCSRTGCSRAADGSGSARRPGDRRLWLAGRGPGIVRAHATTRSASTSSPSNPIFRFVPKTFCASCSTPSSSRASPAGATPRPAAAGGGRRQPARAPRLPPHQRGLRRRVAREDLRLNAARCLRPWPSSDDTSAGMPAARSSSRGARARPRVHGRRRASAGSRASV